jgi:integrase
MKSSQLQTRVRLGFNMEMPRPRLPYVTLEIGRGNRFWYFRRDRGLRVRLPGEWGSTEFLAAYHAALAGEAPQRPPLAATGTLGWLVDTYKESSAWDRLAAATKSQRGNIYKVVTGRAGDALLSTITQETIEQGKEDRARTPFAANDFLKAMKALFGWAKKARHVEIDPAKGVEGFPHKTEGFHVWTEEEIAQFENRWCVGTRERLALSILLFTGLRRGDAARLGRQHVRGGVIILRTAKTGQKVELPVLPELARIIAASKTGDLALICDDDGRPLTKEGFGNWFRKACRAAGVPGRAHGLRKACATRFAEAGATNEEMKSWFAWADGRTADIYTRGANRGKLAQQAARKLNGTP